MEKGLSTSFLDLPNELILNIAEHIDDPRHLSAFLMTNRRLAMLLKTSLHHLAARSGLDRGLIALIWAIARQNEPMLRVLLLSGPRHITIKRRSGETIHRVSRTNSINAETVARVLSEGVAIIIRIRRDNGTRCDSPALHWAARSGNETLVRLLLDKGADISARDRYGQTALHCAAAMNREAVVRLLLCRGADRFAKGYLGDRPLDRAKYRNYTGVITMLLEDAPRSPLPC